MSAPQIITLGCRLNTFESEVMRQGAAQAGLEDAVIINTCAVTAEAERQARQTIRKARRDNPQARIIVTGCAAQLEPDKFSAMAEVDRVVGNLEKLDAATYADDAEAVVVSDIMTLQETAGHLIGGLEGRTRAFVQVQQGCDHRCTFCIIPFARGPNRSVPAGRVVDQVRKLVEGGHVEVVLTGVDISSYGAGDTGLGDLAQQVLSAVPDLKRLRLSSLDPAAIDDTIFRLLAEEPRFMPHLHLSLQALDDTVLKRMKRRHSRDDAFDVIRRARQARADVVFGADLIAGFPTETGEMFENTLSAVGELDLTHLHVFPYSARNGTPAARMPQDNAPARKERAARLRDAGEAGLQRHLKAQVGGLAQVLIERDRRGLTEHYAPVELAAESQPGHIVTARIESVSEGKLVGKLAA